MIPVSVLAELGAEIIGDEEKEENDEKIVNFANATPVASAEELQLALADNAEFFVNNATGSEHTESDWIVDVESTQTERGIRHVECVLCHKVLTTSSIGRVSIGENRLDYIKDTGFAPQNNNFLKLNDSILSTPQTYEFIIKLDTRFDNRGGVLFSNYNGGNSNQISIEIYTNGHARFWYKTDGVSYSALFAADVRSESLTHLAFTVNGSTITLYINGKYSESLTMDAAVPSDCTNFCIGGDYRNNNEQYFKGTIFAVNVFGDIRTAEEIATDNILVASDTADLLYSKYFSDNIA